MKKAYLISTGTELLLGHVVDSNSMYLAQELGEMGIKVVGKSIVGDNRETMAVAFKTGLQMADLVIASGGLGPTRDDLTKEVACETIGCGLHIVEEALHGIEEFFARRQRKMAACNRKQAMFPEDAVVLENRLGTAPGMYLVKDNKVMILLPGPPREMRAMFAQAVKPLLLKEKDLVQKQVQTRLIKVFGPGESQVEETLQEILGDQADYNIALLAQKGEVHINLTAESPDGVEPKQNLDEICQQIEKALGRNIFGYDEETLISVVARQLQQKGLTLAVVESCSGGFLSKMITDLPGSSKYFWGGVVSYSNHAKQKLLGVKGKTLTDHGAVSSETAAEMALGLKQVSGADIAVSITGVAGPEGGSPDKPVGLVYLGLAWQEKVKVRQMHFVGDRNSIRTLAAKSALDLMRRSFLQGEGQL